MISLKFDSSGSAEVKFFAYPAMLRTHWISAGVPMSRMACPDSMKSTSPCLLCRASKMATTQSHDLIVPGHEAKSSEKAIVLVWDIKDKAFRSWMAPRAAIADVVAKMRGLGISGPDMASGLAADVLIQRIGNTYDMVVRPETVGQKRHTKKIPNFGKHIQTYLNSIWAETGNPYEAMLRHPKPVVTSPPEAVQPTCSKPAPAPRLRVTNDPWDML